MLASIYHIKEANSHSNYYRIYLNISRTFMYLKISPKTGVRLILEAMLNDLLNTTNTFENMRLPYLFALALIHSYLINVIQSQ